MLIWPVFNCQHWLVLDIINRLKPVQCLKVRKRLLLGPQSIVDALVTTAGIFSTFLTGIKGLITLSKHLTFNANS